MTEELNYEKEVFKIFLKMIVLPLYGLGCIISFKIMIDFNIIIGLLIGAWFGFNFINSLINLINHNK